MSKRKIRVTLLETLKYEREAIVEVDMSDDELENLLDKAEGEHPDDAILIFERNGAEVIKEFDSNYSSPYDTETEFTEYDEVEE